MTPRLLPLLLGLSLALSGCSDKTGTANRHGVDQPAAKDEAQEGKSVLTVENARAAGIETAIAGPAMIHETLTLYGSIHPNAEHLQEIRARYPGIVRSLTLQAGDAVARDASILSIESNDSLEPYPIRSPIAGTVLERRANPGEVVDSSAILLVIGDLSTVWVELAVFAQDLSRVHSGQSVEVHGSDGARVGKATLNYVAPMGTGDTQSVLARAVLDNREHHWVAGQFVTGDVVVGQAQAPVAVLLSALQTLDGHNVVFVATDQGFSPRVVTLGRRSAEAVEVVEGLSAGERYTSTNSYLVKAELTKAAGDSD